MSENEKSYRIECEGIIFEGKDDGIHDYNLGERLGLEGEPGLPEDKNEPVDLLNDAYDAICIKSAREVRRQADSKCVDAMCMICDSMKLAYEKMDSLKAFAVDSRFVELAEEMATLGDSLAKIRTSMESTPMFTGYGV